MTEVTLKVSGMSCAHCKAAVESELDKVSGVEISNADVERGIVEVAYDENKTGQEQLREAVEEAGYTVV
jgi:copper chaperone